MISDAGSDAQLLKQIIDVLARVAPEARDQPLDADAPLRDQLEMDSMDHLHFLVALKQRFGVDVPDADYAHMRRLNELMVYVRDHSPTR